MSDQLVAEAATYTTDNKHKRNIHVLNGIRTRVSSNQTTADARLRPHGQWGRLSFATLQKKKKKKVV